MDLIDNFKKHSFTEIYSYFVHQVLRISIGKEHYLVLNINIDEVNKALTGFNLPVKELSFNDFLKGDPKEFTPEKLASIKNRIEDSSYKCYGIIEEDRLIYSTWVSLSKLGLSVDTKPIFLDAEEGLLEDSYCDPIARGRSIHGKMNVYRIKKLYELGKKCVVAIVLDGNTPAMKVQIKCGFKEVGTFYNGFFFGIKVNTLNRRRLDYSHK